jgi:hypothetical protein
MEQPLVSIIVRTLGRDSLVRALRSALAQHWRPLEIVVVRAGGERMPELPGSSDVAMRVVEGGRLTRPQAANVGLSAANGDWLTFLDDDDAIKPEHVASLVECASVASRPLVAYSATAGIMPDGSIDGVIFEEFDRRRLLATNYIQIGAALFSRGVVVEGYRFDESFECMQDWDFWIQLSQRTHFSYTGRATNLWSVASGGSGMGGGANCDPQAVAHWRAELTRKWADWSDSLETLLAHHRRCAQAAMRAGDSPRVQAHLAAAERLLRGPVPRTRASFSRDRTKSRRAPAASLATQDRHGA